jgi:hypothetical protein
MEEETRGERARGTSERVYAGVLRASAAIVVLTIFGGLAYLVSIDQIDGGALLLYAGVLWGISSMPRGVEGEGTVQISVESCRPAFGRRCRGFAPSSTS